MNPYQTLELLLRPPGKGVWAASTGRKMADTLLKEIYHTSNEKKVSKIWKKSLKTISKSKVILIGAPSDTGAGVVRGSNMGPLNLRTFLYQNKKFKHWIKDSTVLDIGDIFVIPQLLEDALLRDRQIEKCRSFITSGKKSVHLPVSPLSILRETIRVIFSIHPKARIMLLGGDHSLTWPVVETYAKQHKHSFAILHIDAHTDLLKSRLGIDHCFGTWAYHANNLIGRKKRLVQVGIRASRKNKSYWEKTLGVKQFWAKEVQQKPVETFGKILNHLKSLGLSNIYISNDIDGTSMEYAAATGTPEPHGLHPFFVSHLIRGISKHWNIIGSDLVEVAPVLHLDKSGEPQKTLKVGCQYTLDMIEGMLSRL